MQSKIKCNNCGEEITPNLQTSKYGDIEITYFTCEACSSEYTVCVTNTEIRDLQTKLKDIDRQVRKMASDRKQDISKMQAEYGEKIKVEHKLKVKHKLEKEYKKWLNNTAKEFKPKLQELLDKHETLKKEIFAKAHSLKELYESNS